MNKKFDIGYVFLLLMVVLNLMVISVYGATLIELAGISMLCAIIVVTIQMRTKLMADKWQTNDLK